ncbi:hypothetical protein QUB63_22340 [Microcoleus sp. ARI1-B5]|uniref:hypothetical protein n=1 Tax=unclassified Microcoleus TaxID=2642155 RepID=UPI002FD1906F
MSAEDSQPINLVFGRALSTLSLLAAGKTDLLAAPAVAESFFAKVTILEWKLSIDPY